MIDLALISVSAMIIGGNKSYVLRREVREFEYDDINRLARVSYLFSDEILLKSCRERLDAGLFP